MDQIDLEERSGIYLIILEKWKVCYIGRTNNLKRRLTQHLIEGSHKKEITKYIKLFDDIKYLVLEYTDGYKPKDQAVIEKYWIDHYLRKGINLLNITDPTKEFSYYDSKPLLVYDAENLNFIEEFSSVCKTAKKLKVPQGAISDAVKENLKNGKRRFVVKNYFFFFKEGFTEELLYEKQKRYLDSKKTRRLNISKKTSKKVLQFSKDGNFIQKWNSLMEIQRNLNIQNGNICDCLKGRKKSAGGFIWKYAEESESNNESLHLQNL